MDTSSKQLDSSYVKNYYDNQIAPLASYEQGRWHSSPVREFEYRQTLRSLKRALGGGHYRGAIEIGPGDAVWTPLLRKQIDGNMHLVEQSEEMLKRAKEKVGSLGNITFERSDFATSQPQGPVDLIVASRCLEYFDDKLGALKKMRTLLTLQGKIIIITKNAEMLTGSSVQGKRIHSGQLSRREMKQFAHDAGLEVVETYPAVLRWKASWPLMRVVFDVLHKIATASRGRIVLPFSTYATESYVYIMRARQQYA